jgi:2-polyprenyl-6-methoxyphenol hydroxylase-like FAD-dependent oxidoreductase
VHLVETGSHRTDSTLSRHGHEVTVIERDPEWSVFGVGTLQQANVVRAMDQLGVLDAFLEAARGFDAVEIYIPSRARVARISTPTLVPGKPANVGIGRRALQRVLGETAKALGAQIRLGVVADTLDDDGGGVDVRFSDGNSGRYDIVVGADGPLLADAREPSAGSGHSSLGRHRACRGSHPPRQCRGSLSGLP